MKPEMTISITLLMNLCLFAFTAVTFFSGRKKETTFDTKETMNERLEGSKELLKANIKLEQICATTNETRSDIKSMNNRIELMNETQIRQGMEIKALWERVDQMRDDCPVKKEGK